MILKCSRIVLTFMALASFCSVAETIVPGAEAVANADVVVSRGSSASLTIAPTTNLTVSDIVNGSYKAIASFKVSGNNAAVRLLNAHPGNDKCAYIFGTADNTNKIEVCYGAVINGPSAGGSFIANGNRYRPIAAGAINILDIGGENKNPALTQVRADTYELAMELVQYTL